MQEQQSTNSVIEFITCGKSKEIYSNRSKYQIRVIRLKQKLRKLLYQDHLISNNFLFQSWKELAPFFTQESLNNNFFTYLSNLSSFHLEDSQK